MRPGRDDGQGLPDGHFTCPGLENRAFSGGLGVGSHLETNRGLAGSASKVSGTLRRLELLVREIAACLRIAGRRQSQIAYGAHAGGDVPGARERHQVCRREPSSEPARRM